MQDLIWDNTLSVQVDEIDEDHRRLVETFNLLGHAVEEGAAREYVEALLEELLACTDWHFKHEERLMLQHGYPELESHRKEHQELIDSIRALHDERLRAGRPLSAGDVEYLEHWLTGHILGSDMELGAWLNEQA